MMYLDNAATTPLDDDILNVMMPYLSGTFGNASSQHSYGRTAANAVVAARDDIAAILNVPSKDVYFTSGGTEAGNTALKGVCSANMEKGKHIVLSAIEHPALIESAQDLTKWGWQVTFVNPDKSGAVSPEDIQKAIRPDTVFVGLMAANNETGVIQPVKAVYDICKRKNVFLYCDCVQTAGVIPFEQFPADGIGISAHKFYGPKGVGALYIKGGTKFSRLLSGGHQERAMRGGTTNTAGVVGCAAALKKAVEGADKNNAKVLSLRNMFIERVLSEIDGTRLNGDKLNRLPANANISFEGCDGQNLLFLLDMAGVAVSTGSACSSGAVTPSHVLTAMGLTEKQAKSAIRFTFGKYNTVEDVSVAVDRLKSAVQKIRKK
jgi:cysteine desulfurase